MGDGETGGLADDRRSVESHEVTFGAFLRARGLWLRADLLSPWAHWITPRFQPRRFDTRFFVAMLPPGQSAGVLTTESDHGGWVTIQRALADVRGGTMEMMRPTRHTLRQLRAIGDRPVEEAAMGRVITAIEPTLVEIERRPLPRRPGRRGAMTMTDVLQVWRGEGRHEITLNRPRRRNAINRELNAAIVAALRAFDGDADARVAVLTGTDPAFCAGMDLTDLGWADRSPGDRGDTFASALRAVRKPVIAAVNGPAITGGFELALGADFILASEHAFFGDTHARVGVFPGGGMTVYLAQAVGVRRAAAELHRRAHRRGGGAAPRPRQRGPAARRAAAPGSRGSHGRRRRRRHVPDGAARRLPASRQPRHGRRPGRRARRLGTP